MVPTNSSHSLLVCAATKFLILLSMRLVSLFISGPSVFTAWHLSLFLSLIFSFMQSGSPSFLVLGFTALVFLSISIYYYFVIYVCFLCQRYIIAWYFVQSLCELVSVRVFSFLFLFCLLCSSQFNMSRSTSMLISVVMFSPLIINTFIRSLPISCYDVQVWSVLELLPYVCLRSCILASPDGFACEFQFGCFAFRPPPTTTGPFASEDKPQSILSQMLCW